MSFDVEGARKAGYSDAEIADHLASESKFDAAGARKSGYSDSEIIQHLVGEQPAAAPEAKLATSAPVDDATSGLASVAQILQGGVNIPQALGGALQKVGQIGANVGQFFGPVADPSQIGNRLAVLFPGYNPGSPSARLGGGATELGVGVAAPNMLGGMMKSLPVVGPLGEAIQSFGGAKDVGRLTNVLGGAVAGATGAGVVDVNNAPVGAALGAAVPLLGALVSNPTVRRWADNILPGGSDRQITRVLGEALGNDPARIQRALDLVNSGRTVEQVAVEMNEPGLAAIAAGAPKANPATTKLFADQQQAREIEQVNKLAGAAGYVEPAAANANALAASTKAAEDAALQQRQAAAAKALEDQKAADARHLAQFQSNLEAKAAPGAAVTLPATDLAAQGAALRKAGNEEAAKIVETEVRPAYDRVTELAGDAPIVEVKGIADMANNIKDLTWADGSVRPSSVLPVLARFKGGAPIPNETFMGLGVPSAGTTTPAARATITDVGDLLKAIHVDARAAARTSDNVQLKLLNDMEASVRKALEDSPGVTPEIRKAMNEADELFKTKIVPRFRTGEQEDVLRDVVNNQPRVVDEAVIDKFFRPEGQTGAKNLVAMIGDNQQAKDAAIAGIRERFRREVTTDGAVDPAKVRRFLSDKGYGPALAELEKGGISLRPEFEAAGGKAAAGETVANSRAENIKAQVSVVDEAQKAQLAARKAAMDAAQTQAERDAAERIGQLEGEAKTLAGKSKVIEGLRKKFLENPTDTTAAKSLSEAEQAIADVVEHLRQGKRFKKLAALGSESMNAKGFDVPGRLKAPVGIQTEIIYNNIDAFLSKRMGAKAADTLARELMDMPEFAARLAKVASKQAPRVKLNALAPAVLPGYNALRSD